MTNYDWEAGYEAGRRDAAKAVKALAGAAMVAEGKLNAVSAS